jgi:hypothetical protein
MVLCLTATKVYSISKGGSKFRDHFGPEPHPDDKELPSKETQDIKEHIKSHVQNTSDVGQ